MSEVIRIPLKKIEMDTDQPRKTFDEIKGLAKSILNQGLLEPLKVIQITENSYRLLDGERRYMALEVLSKKDEKFSVANCIIMNPRGNKLIAQLSFDVQKSKIPLLEESEAFKKLIESGAYTVKELAMLVGKTSSYIKGRLKISSLNEQTKEYIKKGDIRAGIFTLIDIDSLKQSEDRIVQRVKDEKPKRYEEIQRIIIEETQKFESMIYLFRDDLTKLKNRIEDFERRAENIETPKIQEIAGDTLMEATKTIKKFADNFDKFIKIREETIFLRDKLQLLSKKYGKGAELNKEILKELEDEDERKKTS